ncbi:MAG TPA: 4-(cytidine 5'-diphospho)-2-C-methyl-D-erythritol kinase [Prolixibacteraceae bacterium]|nr:4-(cytidine 5'-diphospho)-2-C-methyl-D-erythritol kinase [Prolixibacteraceae bacterium]
MITFPNAKINLGLHVVSKRQDGYHNLETVFYPVKLADALEMVEADETVITFSGIPIGGSYRDNLVYKAWQLLQADYNVPPVRFHLHKVIPFGAGLGGGSADAAFALKMMNTHFSLQMNDARLKSFAAKIGADCSFFIQNKPVFAEGIGDEFSPVDIDLSDCEIVILKPDCFVSTPEAYRHVKPAQPAFDLKKIGELPLKEWKNTVVNGFEQSVFLQYPQIRKLKNILYENGAVYAAMSGSGSAVYGIFQDSPTNIDESIPDGVFIYR